MPPAFSFGTSQRSKAAKVSKDSQGPGPGEYAPYKYHNAKPPTWKIGNQSRGKFEANDAPGPGAYNNSFVTKRSFPIYQFGLKIPRGEVGNGVTPGPGTYDSDSKVGVAKTPSQYSFGLRLQRGGPDENLRETMQGPGPAAYEGNYSTVLKRPSSRFGKQMRKGLYDESGKYIPGVGTYNTRPSTAGPFNKFGSSTRDSQFFSTSNQTPGPGTYMFESTLRNISSGKTMNYRHPYARDERVDFPGPGEYESYVDQVKRGNPKYRIGTALRRDLHENEGNNPGPGTYASNVYDKKRPPSYKIGTQSRGQIQDTQTPGPGSYDMYTEKGGKQYTLRTKPGAKEFDETPGPQDYYPQVTYTNKRPASCKLGQEARDKQLSKTAGLYPGPDQYNVSRNIGGPKYPFGTESRVTNNPLNNPGPGQYDIPPYFANNPAYLIPNQAQSLNQFGYTK